jgi:hypothetical protein
LDRISNTYGKVRYLSKSESGCGLFGMILLHQRIICWNGTGWWTLHISFVINMNPSLISSLVVQLPNFFGVLLLRQLELQRDLDPAPSFSGGSLSSFLLAETHRLQG